MDEAKKHLARHEKVFVTADTQLNGRGQRGATWVSPVGGLYCTYGEKVTGSAISFAGLSLVIGVCLVESLKLHDAGISLKWPNDLVQASTKRKLAGILIETAVCGDVAEIFVGVGLNLKKQNNCGGIAAIGLEELSDVDASKKDLGEISSLVEQSLQQGVQSFLRFGFVPWKERFLSMCAFTEISSNETRFISILNSHGRSLEGSFNGVSDEGALILQDGEAVHTIVSGHITGW